MGQDHEGLVRVDCVVGKDRQASPDMNSGKDKISWWGNSDHCVMLAKCAYMPLCVCVQVHVCC